jgi:hypothetical protein
MIPEHGRNNKRKNPCCSAHPHAIEKGRRFAIFASVPKEKKIRPPLPLEVHFESEPDPTVLAILHLDTERKAGGGV